MAGLYKFPLTSLKGLCPFISLLLPNTSDSCFMNQRIEFIMMIYSKLIFQLFYAKLQIKLSWL